MNYKIRIFEQVRGDGTKYYMARVDFTRKWFFGLFTNTTEMTVRKYVNCDEYFLSEIVRFENTFKSKQEAYNVSENAIKNHFADKAKSKIVSFKEVEV